MENESPITVSHVAKTKIIDPQLMLALWSSKENETLDLTGDKGVYIVFGDEPDKVRGVLEAHGIPFKESELNHLDEAFSTIYSPSRIEAGKLAKLLDDPLVEVVEPQKRDMGKPGPGR